MVRILKWFDSVSDFQHTKGAKRLKTTTNQPNNDFMNHHQIAKNYLDPTGSTCDHDALQEHSGDAVSEATMAGHHMDPQNTNQSDKAKKSHQMKINLSRIELMLLTSVLLRQRVVISLTGVIFSSFCGYFSCI